MQREEMYGNCGPILLFCVHIRRLVLVWLEVFGCALGKLNDS